MDHKLQTLLFSSSVSSLTVVKSLKVCAGDHVQKGTVLATYGVPCAEEGAEEPVEVPFKSTVVGKVDAVLCKEGDVLQQK